MLLYLDDKLNDTGGVEQAVAYRVMAAWIKFRDLGAILCIQGAYLWIKGVVCRACLQLTNVRHISLGNERKAFQVEQQREYQK